MFKIDKQSMSLMERDLEEKFALAKYNVKLVEKGCDFTSRCT